MEYWVDVLGTVTSSHIQTVKFVILHTDVDWDLEFYEPDILDVHDSIWEKFDILMCTIPTLQRVVVELRDWTSLVAAGHRQTILQKLPCLRQKSLLRVT